MLERRKTIRTWGLVLMLALLATLGAVLVDAGRRLLAGPAVDRVGDDIDREVASAT